MGEVHLQLQIETTGVLSLLERGSDACSMASGYGPEDMEWSLRATGFAAVQEELEQHLVFSNNDEGVKDMLNTVRIAAAIAATREVDSFYWQQTLLQRLPSGTGSVVSGCETPEALEQQLLSAKWESYSHSAVMEGCEAFMTRDVVGQLGVVELAKLSADTPVVLDDRKGTGKVSATVSGVRGDEMDFTVLIVGEMEDHEIVFTFHPGEPVSPSKVQAVPGLHGKVVTVADAMEMGLTTAKIV